MCGFFIFFKGKIQDYSKLEALAHEFISPRGPTFTEKKLVLIVIYLTQYLQFSPGAIEKVIASKESTRSSIMVKFIPLRMKA